MVMDLLGSSLEDLFIQKNKQLSLKTIVMLSEQMVLYYKSSFQELNIFIQKE